jgi:hypothetical protein
VAATIEPIGPPDPGARQPPLWKRLIWFFGLALGGLISTGLVAYGLKALLPPH